MFYCYTRSMAVFGMNVEQMDDLPIYAHADLLAFNIWLATSRDIFFFYFPLSRFTAVIPRSVVRHANVNEKDQTTNVCEAWIFHY